MEIIAALLIALSFGTLALIEGLGGPVFGGVVVAVVVALVAMAVAVLVRRPAEGTGTPIQVGRLAQGFAASWIAISGAAVPGLVTEAPAPVIGGLAVVLYVVVAFAAVRIWRKRAGDGPTGTVLYAGLHLFGGLALFLLLSSGVYLWFIRGIRFG